MRTLRFLISAYVRDPFVGSEGANAWFTAEGLAQDGADVRILTRDTDAEQTEAGIQQYSASPSLGSMTASYLSDLVPRGLSSRQLGVYAHSSAINSLHS